LDITSGGVQRKYHLQGLIYYAAEHFTARFIAQLGMVWYHNGLLTGRSLVYEGTVFLRKMQSWVCMCAQNNMCFSKELGYAMQRDGPLAQVKLLLGS
ncbi:hypothetical protein L208DRAFT_1270708, partial [Tricholoma matsutake]